LLQLDAAQTGLRRYLSLRGGIDVAPVLGSRATDTFSGVGPAPLAPGTLLPIGVPHLPVPDVDVAAVAPLDADPVLTITAGPRADWFRSDALVGRFYTVSPDSDRVAVRLRGKRVRRTVERDLAPEGLVRGAVQVPSDGQPLIFLGGPSRDGRLSRRGRPHRHRHRPGCPASSRPDGSVRSLAHCDTLTASSRPAVRVGTFLYPVAAVVVDHDKPVTLAHRRHDDGSKPENRGLVGG
jgi:hypothetical protein